MKTAALLLLALLFSGCTRTAPLDEKIHASSVMTLNLWRNKHQRTLTPEQWKAFDLALQEHKFEIMFKNEASGSEAIEQLMLSRINDRRLVEILKKGFDLKLTRLESEKADYEKMLGYNANFRTREGDIESARHLAALRERQQLRLDQIKADLAATRELKLAALPEAGAK